MDPLQIVKLLVLPLFQFRKPKMALIILGITAMGLTLAIYPADYIEKFGFSVAIGLGVGFLANGVKALVAEYGNLAVLVVYCGIVLVLSAALGTPKAVLATNGLEDYASVIVATCLGYFMNLEEG